MLYQFHQAVVLKGKHFGLGLHEVSEVLENDPHFLKYVGVGYITEPNGMPPAAHQSVKEKAEALLNKLREGKVKNSPGPVPVKAEEPVAPVVVEESPVEEEEEAKAPSPSHSSGHSHSSSKVHSKKKEK